MFDIRTLVPSETAFMRLRDIEGNPQTTPDGTEPGIEFYGPGTKIHKSAQNDYIEALRKMLDRKKDATQEETLHLRTSFLARVTKNFVGFEFPGGPLALYRDLELGYIADDATKFLDERGNFKRTSAPDSSSTFGTSPG